MTENTNETAEPVATADLSLLSEDAREIYGFALKATQTIDNLSVGSESEAETLFRIFSDADDKTKKAEILALVSKARENVPDEETVKAGIEKAVRKYNAALLAWEDEETPEGFIFPTLPESVKKKKTSDGRGAGVPRPRGLRAATAEYGSADLKSEKGYLTCATLAQKIGDGVTTASLFDAWKSAAGADSEAWTDGLTHTVEVPGTKNTHKVTFFYKS